MHSRWEQMGLGEEEEESGRPKQFGRSLLFHGLGWPGGLVGWGGPPSVSV